MPQKPLKSIGKNCIFFPFVKSYANDLYLCMRSASGGKKSFYRKRKPLCNFFFFLIRIEKNDGRKFRSCYLHGFLNIHENRIDPANLDTLYQLGFFPDKGNSDFFFVRARSSLSCCSSNYTTLTGI